MERVIREKTDKEKAKDKENQTKAFATGVVGIISFIILFLGPQIFSEFVITRPHQFVPTYIGFLGILLYLGMSCENSEILDFLWKYRSTKLLISVAISYVLIISGAKSSSIINSVFGVDGGTTPYTMALLTPILFILTIKWLLYFFVILSVFLSFGIISEYRYSGDIKYNYLGFVLSSIFITAFIYFQSAGSLSNDGLKIKTYKLAHQFDFSNVYDCTAVSTGKSVLFLTPDHNQVLADEKLNIDESFQNFFRDVNIDKYDKIGNFNRIICDKL
jgi:hypothetical protein